MSIVRILYRSFYWKILQFLISFLISVSFARLFLPGITAEFYAFIYLLSLAVSFWTLGFDISLSYFLSRNEIQTEQANSITVLLILAALAFSIPFLGLIYRSAIYPNLTRTHFLLYGAYYISGSLLTICSSAIFTAHHKSHIASCISAIVGLTLLVSVGLLYQFQPRTEIVKQLFLIYFLSILLQGLVLFCYSGWTYCRAQWFALSTKIVGIRMVRFSIFIFLINLIFFTANKACVLLLPYFIKPDDLGNYIMSFKIVEYIQVLISFTYYPFIALVAVAKKDSLEPNVLMLVRMSNTFVLVVSVFIIAFGKTLFPLVFGHGFDGIYINFLSLIPGLFAACSSTFFTAYYFGTGKLKYNLISACILMTTMLLFFFLLIPFRTTMAVGLAFSLASIASLIYDALIFMKFRTYSIKQILFLIPADLVYLSSFLKKRKSSLN